MKQRPVGAACPRCGFARGAGAVECARCGVVFAKLERKAAESRELPEIFDGRAITPPAVEEEPHVADGRVGRAELVIMATGLAAAVVASIIPLTNVAFSALKTLFHELGHAVFGWMFGYPSIPAFDFVYGGGLTHYGNFQVAIAAVVAGAFAYGLWLFRENRRSMIIIAAAALVWLFFVTAEWRRELACASAGHLFEFVLAGVLFYKALAGVGWKIPEIERPLGAFAAFFVQIHSMTFAWRLTRDPDYLAWYREGKGGALMNDLEIIALNLRIYTPIDMSIESVARALLVFSVVPIAVALIWYFQRSRWHRILRGLTTAET